MKRAGLWGLLATTTAAVACLAGVLTKVPVAESGRGEHAEGRWVHGVGYVEPATGLRRLSFKSNGVLDHYRIQVGSSVSRGAVLGCLRNNEEQAAVAVAEAEVQTARAALDRLLAGTHPSRIAAARHTVTLLKVRLAHSRREAERNKVLSQSHAVADVENQRTRTTYREAEANLQRAEAELDHLVNAVRPADRAAAEAEVRVAEARLEWRKRQLENTILRAPCAGQVLEIFKREGDAVRLADNEPVLLFGDLARLRVRAEIEERFARKVRQGQQVILFGRGLDRETYSGKVGFVKRVMGRKTVFSQAPAERKDLSMIEVLIEPESRLVGPVGLPVDVKVALDE